MPIATGGRPNPNRAHAAGPQHTHTSKVRVDGHTHLSSLQLDRRNEIGNCSNSLSGASLKYLARAGHLGVPHPDRRSQRAETPSTDRTGSTAKGALRTEQIVNWRSPRDVLPIRLH